MLTRRSFISNLLAAPAIVPVRSLMPLRGAKLYPHDRFGPAFIYHMFGPFYNVFGYKIWIADEHLPTFVRWSAMQNPLSWNVE